MERVKRVGRREFLHNPGKYLQAGVFILTNRGIDELVVTVNWLYGGEEILKKIEAGGNYWVRKDDACT